jgi:Diaminopimelate decarboxylase
MAPWKAVLREWWQRTDADGGKRIGFDDYARAVVPLLKPLGLKILLEPGRSLVGNAGALLASVLYVKKTPAKNFVITDAGMNDLIRPALYEGHHEIVPLKEPLAGVSRGPVDVVGPVCESGDFFAQDRALPEVTAGEQIALMSAGAYGFVMASNYNSRRLPAEILVEAERAVVVRERQTWEDLIAGERVPGR